MADSAHFPAKIGGSGRSYTADANPDTGMFDGGHRRNMIPMAADMVSAAGYVSQYASAIDGAKANADKAEDARGYVKAFADGIRFSVLDNYRRRATLGLDFVRGHYFVDDGERIESSDLTKVMSFERASPKWARSPNVNHRMYSSDNPARSWLNGKSGGISLENEGTNLALSSSDISTRLWSSFEGVTRLERAGHLTIVHGNGSGSNRVAFRYANENVINVEAGRYYTFSGTFKPLAAQSLLVYVGGAFTEQGGASSVRVRFDTAPLLASVAFNEAGSDVKNLVFEPLGDGSYFFSFTVRCYSNASERPIYYASDVDLIGSTRASGPCIGIGNLQVEDGQEFSFHIPTDDSAVTRSKDVLYKSLGDEFNASGSTFYMEFNPRLLGYRRGILTLALAPESANNNFGIFTGQADGNLELASFTYEAGGDNQNFAASVRANQWHRVAFSFNSKGEVRASWNGRRASQMIGGAVVELLGKRLSLCVSTSAGRVLGAANGYEAMSIREILLVPDELSNAELEEMTR
ncbi:phage head spike fiber domain-containing protein [Vreelandella sp. EE7]